MMQVVKSGTPSHNDDRRCAKPLENIARLAKQPLHRIVVVAVAACPCQKRLMSSALSRIAMPKCRKEGTTASSPSTRASKHVESGKQRFEIDSDSPLATVTTWATVSKYGKHARRNTLKVDPNSMWKHFSTGSWPMAGWCKLSCRTPRAVVGAKM